MKITSKYRRMSKVLSMAFAIFLQIYWFKITKKRKDEWDKLWVKIGKKFRQTLFELEGLLIKIGQLLSIRGDLLPGEFIKQIQDLTDRVPPSEWQQIEKILQEEWDGTLEQLHYIEKKAVASASIGEVYKGTLKNGHEVAIKVLRPEIQSIIETDFRTLKIITWFADHFVPVPKGFINFKVLYNEIKQVIEKELDFAQELKTLLSFKDQFKDHDFVKIPNVYPELSTKRVLVMEWVEGVRLNDEQRLDQFNIDRVELAKRLLQIFLPQWLEPGLFHADPHTGNVLVSKEGTIILLDFGMISEISRQDATHLQKLIEAFITKNYSNAVDSLIQMGFLLPEADPKVMEQLFSDMMSLQPKQLGEMDLLRLKMEMNDLVKALPIQVPTRFVFLGRSFVTIEGVIQTLLPDEDIFELVKPVFMDWLKKQGNRKWDFIRIWLQSQPIFRTIHSFNEFLKLPQKLEQLKETEQRREFQFTIYENYKKQLFLVAFTSMIGAGVGFYLREDLIWQVTLGIFAISSVGYLITDAKLKKWMKYMHGKRR